MALTKVIKCPRCNKGMAWDDKADCCQKCGLEIIPQGREIANPFVDCGVVFDETYATILIHKRKK